MTFILQGNDSVSGRFRRLDVSGSKGENASLLVNLVNHKITRCPYLATFVTC